MKDKKRTMYKDGKKVKKAGYKKGGKASMNKAKPC